MELLGETEIKERVAGIMLAREHWLFLPGFSGGPALIDIEDTFYKGEKNHDFEVMVGTNTQGRIPFIGIAFAAKCHLSAAALAAHINKRLPDHAPITSEILEERDVIFLARAPEAHLIAEDFAEWIGPVLQEKNDALTFSELNTLDV